MQIANAVATQKMERRARVIAADKKKVKDAITVSQADKLVNAASRPADGAIEDAEQRGSKMYYFFESGAVGIVDLNTKAVKIDRSKAA